MRQLLRLITVCTLGLIITFLLLKLVSYAVKTNNFYMIIPAYLLTMVVIIAYVIIPKKNLAQSTSSSAGVNRIESATANSSNGTEKLSSNEIESSIPDPIEAGYDIPLI